jgi:hypothetical protein
MSERASSEWGRIDDDGTVFVKSPDGEREIGSWHAGDAEAGLRFYTVRYEDLAAEIDLLEKRLESGTGDPAATRAHALAMKQRLPAAAVIGDLAALDVRLDAVLAAADTRAGEAQAAREQARADAVAAKEALVAEARDVAENATSWKVSGDRLRAIVEEWKQIKGVDRKTDDALWKQFAAARDAFGKRRGQHFAQLDAERGSAKTAKENLVARAEELSTSSDWRETAAAMRDLMTQWKAAPRAGRDAEDALWSRFRAAQDAFFARRSETFAERDAEQLTNQRRKEAVIAKAAALDVSDPRSAQAALRELQVEFDGIGHVPRDAMRRLDDQMRAAEQRVRSAVDTQWRAASASSNPFIAELRARLAEAEEKLERARRSGDPARIKKAEDEIASRKALLPD